MIKNLGVELEESVGKWEKQIKEFDELIPSLLPKSEASITLTPLSVLEDWLNETDKRLTELNTLTKETLTTAKTEPKTYKKLLEDLQNAEEIRKKEAAIADEKAQLQEKFGSRFNGLETNWQDIVNVLDWTKKVQAEFHGIVIPQAFAEVAAKGPTAAPSDTELTQKLETALKSLSDFEARFEAPIKYQNQHLKDLEIKVIGERIQSLRNRVDDLQVWIDFKDLRNHFALRGLDQFFNSLAEKKSLPRTCLMFSAKRVCQEWINSLYNQDPKLGKFRRENHEQLITDFTKLDRDLIKLTSSMVIEQANSRKPQDILIQAADPKPQSYKKKPQKNAKSCQSERYYKKCPICK